MIDIIYFKKVKVNKGSKNKEDTESEEKSNGEEEDKAKKLVVSPVTIWIGIFSNTASAMAAHNAAQDVLTLLKNYQITNIDIKFYKSLYVHEVGPYLLRSVHGLDSCIDIVSLLTSALRQGQAQCLGDDGPLSDQRW
jgi:hypothetical protein